VNAFTIAALALLLGFVPLVVVCLRETELDGVVALELAGALAALVFLCLGEGFHRSSYFTVPVVAAALSWVSGMVFVRFFARNDEQEDSG
jgi:multisubunit Na+/H+ antiporter MnhF subunit